MTQFRLYDVVVERPGLQCPKGYLLWEFARSAVALNMFGPAAELVAEWSKLDEGPLYAEVLELLGARFRSSADERRYWPLKHDLLLVAGEFREGNLIGSAGEYFRVGPVVSGRAFADRATMTERLEAGLFDRQIERHERRQESRASSLT